MKCWHVLRKATSATNISAAMADWYLVIDGSMEKEMREIATETKKQMKSDATNLGNCLKRKI